MFTDHSRSKMALRTFVLFLIVIVSAYSEDARTAELDPKVRIFNGYWWEKIDVNEKIGFLYALYDCYSPRASIPTLFQDSYVSMEKSITDYYASANRAISIENAIKRIKSQSKKAPVGERDAKFGGFDREYWAPIGDSERRGYVESYIACRSHYANSPKWSQPVDYYVKSIGEMYNIEEVDGRRTFNDTIVNALNLLKD